ncbi:MAG: heavy-metal-associated domain-containing protein [Nitrolancea sp.]
MGLMSVHVYRVPDVSCEHCVSAITGELKKIDGVQSVDVNLDTKLVTVESADSVEDASLRAGIDEAGYDIEA